MRIITDSAADFTAQELKQYNIHCVSTEVILGGQSYTARVNLSDEDFWQRLLSGEDAKTSQPAPAAFLAAFEEARAAGEEAVCVCISSAVSGTYQSAVIARDMLGAEGIYLVDTLNGAAGQKLMVLHACRLRDEGRLTAAEIAQRLEKLRSRVHLYASLDTLENLARSGRIPKAVAGIGTVAHLKPLLEVTRDGRIAMGGKAFGRRRAIEGLAKKIAEFRMDPAHPIIPLYSYCTDNCKLLMQKLSDLGVKVDVSQLCAIGPSIGPHIGPGAYGAAFVEAE